MSTPPGQPVFRFGEFAVDAAAFALTRGDTAVHLARQPMEVLLLLLERHGALVTRDEIAGRLWPNDVFVDRDAGIHTAILKVRQALAEDGSTCVETVPAKGYRFVADVQILPGRRTAASAGAPQGPRRDNLPADLTTFIGRTREIDDLTRLVHGNRLVTLTGTGGVGKSRLALRVAAQLVDSVAHGVWVVDLAPLVDATLIAPTIAAVLGVRESAGRTVREAVIDTLRQRHVLLLLDTCEHLIGPCAELVAALLRESDSLRILATSRESLAVPGEAVYRVPSLSLPGEATVTAATLSRCEAAQLFIARATLSDPAFRVADDNADVIARICRRLDGIPLAIELAAARVFVLSLEQIEARLHARFRLLTGGARTAVPRQRTLQATVEWSYQLLSDDERILANRLTIFPASWTIGAAEHVVGGDGFESSHVLECMSRLVDKSLLVVEPGTDGARRYRFLETVRHYISEPATSAGEIPRLRARHFDFYFHAFRGSLAVLRGPDQVVHLRRIEDERDNLRAALQWAFASDGSAARGVELAGALFWYWTKRGLFEEGRTWLEQAVRLDADARFRACALIGLAHMDHFQGHQQQMAATAARALAHARGVDDWWAVSAASFLQALAAFELGHAATARAHAEEARSAADRGCDAIEHGGPLMILANLALMDGDPSRAQQLYDQSIDVHRRRGDCWGLSILLAIAAGLLVLREEWRRSRAYALEAMALAGELGDPRGLAWSLEVSAGLLAAGGKADGAARLWGAAEALLERVGGTFAPTIGGLRTRYGAQVRATLGEPMFERLRREGRDLPIAGATGLAEDLTGEIADMP